MNQNKNNIPQVHEESQGKARIEVTNEGGLSTVRTERLPNDVWYKILNDTDILTISKCRFINIQLHQVSYEMLKKYENVSILSLFSYLRTMPTKEDIIETLNALPNLKQLTIRVPDIIFRFNVGDTFCKTHVSTTLRRVVFYSCHLNINNLIKFLNRCLNVVELSLCCHDSIDDTMCHALLSYSYQFIDLHGYRRFQRFELFNTKNISKSMISDLIDGFLSHSILLFGLGQFQHIEFGSRHDNQQNISVLKKGHVDEGEEESGLILKFNQHLRRLTIGNGGGTNRIRNLEINRCPLYSIKISKTVKSECNDLRAHDLNIRKLSITYGRWLSTIQCDIENGFHKLQQLDLTGSDKLKGDVLNKLFGLGKCERGEIKMKGLKRLILCETLIEDLWLVGYHQLTHVDVGSCVMLTTICIKDCQQLEVLEMDPSGCALLHVDVHVNPTCQIKGMPQWIVIGGRDANAAKIFQFGVHSH